MGAADDAPVCPSCEGVLTPELILDDYEPPIEDVAEGRAVEDVPVGMKRLEVSFTGTAGEYFRIWIVNTFLTIITLGIYGAWAKVRTRKYFYRNTILDGQPFDYVADPKAILVGYMIVGAGLVLYNVSPLISPFMTIAVAVLFVVAFPFLMYKSIRFFAHNSTYRNIRMRFRGTLGESYLIYLLTPILIPLTLGLIIPYWAYRKKEYFFRNISYGATDSTFRGIASRFYRPYLLMWAMVFGVGIVMVFAVPFLANVVSSEGESAGIVIALFVLCIYLFFIMSSVYVQQYLYAWTTNYCFGHCSVGNVQLQSTLNGNRLFWIRFTNVLAILFSVGLLIPWAKVRRANYILNNMAVVTRHGLDDFAAASEVEESAYGDAATEFMDFEIGL
jgi:uncharacterized membrane protein YjgN (DUF898 family)